MSEQREAFERDMSLALNDHDHFEEILAPWVGVRQVFEVDGMEITETLTMVTSQEAFIERNFFLSRLPKSVSVSVAISEEK